MRIARLGGESRHGRADEVGQAPGIFRMAGSDIVANHGFGGKADLTGSFARVDILRADALHHHASARHWVGGIIAGGLLEHRCEAGAHGPVVPQQIGEGNGAGRVITIEYAGVETGLAAEGGVKTWWVYPKRGGDVRDADRVIAMRMEKLLRGTNCFFGIEASGPTPCPGFICSHHYKTP